jgi:hypothetical protein
MKCRFYVATIAYLAYFSYLRSVFQDSRQLMKTSALLDEKSTSLV